MRIRSNEPYWLLKNGILKSYSSLQKDTACEVLIVGGGITGALMSFQLCSEGYKTILIDKRDISLGSTSATTSLLQYELDEPLHSLIDKVGQEAAVDTYQAGVEAIQKLRRMVKTFGIACDFEMKKSLFVARTEKDAKWLTVEFECRKKIKLEVRWLTKAQLLAEFGVAGFGGILSEIGGSMDAYQLSHFLIDYCVKHHGLQVYDHTSMEKVEYQAAGNIVSTESGMITCRHMVLATGYETHSLIKENIGELIGTYAFISEPIENLPSSISDILLWDTDSPYLYVRTTSDNRVLVGGCDVRFKNPTRRDLLIEKKQAALYEKFKKLMPGISLIPDFSWAGTFGVTKDALPYMGTHPDFPNSYFVLGFGGNGITFSIMGMEIISDAIAGKHNRFLQYFKFNR